MQAVGNHENEADPKDTNTGDPASMKILISTDCYLFNTGGITASVLALCTGLRRLGHEVRTLSLSNCHKSFRDGDDYYIKSFPAFYYPGMRMSFAMRDPLLKELEAWDPDLIHIQTEGAPRSMALRIRKHCCSPIVMTCHTDYGHFVFGRCKSWLPVKKLMQTVGWILYRQADRVIAPSQKAAGFPFLYSVRDRITVVPNGMAAEKYQKHLPEEKRRAFRASLGICARMRTLVTVSRLSKEKNVQELISFLPALIRKNPNIKLLIVGDGPYKKRLEGLTEKLQLSDSVIFTGMVPSEDVWRYYDAGDLFVSASTFEVHSMSYLESLANGLPLLCRADDALAGVLDHGKNGMIYHSEKEFVDYTIRILADERIRKDMGRRSLLMAENYSSGTFASSVFSVYEDAIHENAKRK